MSRLLHYSATPITLDRAHVYWHRGGGKPPGLWFSVEGDHDWLGWCKGEGLALEALAYPHEVILAPQRQRTPHWNAR